MTTQPSGLRERKKQQQRQRLVKTAETLFAEHGYDAVSMSDIARLADVAGQTMYNYFPAKHDLVLDRAKQIRDEYVALLLARAPGTSPASVFRDLVRRDVDRYRRVSLDVARGQYPALCYQSQVLRGVALQMREAQILAVTEALVASGTAAPRLVVQAHVASLIWLVQAVTDRIGASVLADNRSRALADALQIDADAVLDDLDRHYTLIEHQTF